MNFCWENMGNEAVSYKPYGMLADQGTQQNQHKSCKSNKSHKTNGNNGNNFMSDKIGMNVRINRGGPESLEGRLIGVQPGYLVLKSTGGTVYVSSSHVKSVTDLAAGSGGSNGSRGSRGSNGSRGTMNGGKRTFIMTNSFVGVLHALTRKFVQINWGGPERIEGFIAQVGSEALLLVVGPELVQIPLYHIKTVKTAGMYASGGSKGSGGNKNNNNNNNKNNNNNNNDNANKNSSSGGSKNSSSGGNRNASNRNTSSKNSKSGKKSGKTSSIARKQG